MGKTSSAVKNRYAKKHYLKVYANMPIETATAFKAKCAEKGVTQSEIIRKLIEDFLAEE